MKSSVILCAGALFVAASVAEAGPKTKVSVLWQDFPHGTRCAAEGVKGTLKIGQKQGHPKVDVRGFGEVSTFLCVLPDGRKIVTDITRRLPPGTKTAGITIYPYGRTFLTASAAAGLVSQ